jgi:hypothetical protein
MLVAVKSLDDTDAPWSRAVTVGEACVAPNRNAATGHSRPHESPLTRRRVLPECFAL